jgi:hypothetical protein
VQVLSSQQLEQRNSGFWAGNGTPILMMLITVITVFAGAAIFGSQRAEHAAVRPTFRTLRSVGLTSTQAAQIDVARGLLRLGIALLPALALSFASIQALNSTTLGFHASLNVTVVLAATGVVVVATVCAGLLSWLTERGHPLSGP